VIFSQPFSLTAFAPSPYFKVSAGKILTPAGANFIARGIAIDPGGLSNDQAVQASGYGSAAWIWGDTGSNVDNLVNNDSTLTDYGVQVAGWIAS
jgi:hypothetical protein